MSVSNGNRGTVTSGELTSAEVTCVVSRLEDCASRAWKAGELVVVAELALRGMMAGATLSAVSPEEFDALLSIVGEARQLLRGMDETLDEQCTKLCEDAS